MTTVFTDRLRLFLSVEKEAKTEQVMERKARENQWQPSSTIARPCIMGTPFDSQKEADRYQQLRLMERAGLIHKIELQPRDDLVVNGHKIGFYRADFRSAVVTTSILVGEDVKSPATKTAVYQRKQEARKGMVWY